MTNYSSKALNDKRDCYGKTRPRNCAARENLETMKHYLAITKALSDSSRVRMLCALRSGELCVCQLIELLRLAPSTVSKHLSILNQAGLVESRKDGRWVYYRLPPKNASDLATRMTKETFRALSDSAAIAEDDNRLGEIREADLEQLCREIQCKS